MDPSSRPLSRSPSMPLLVLLLAAAAGGLGWLIDGATGAVNILASLTVAGLVGYVVWAVPLRLRF